MANQFCKGLRFFAIDEFQVLDIADAMILKRLFESFVENRLIVFFTSNRPPEDLYKNGLQRAYFLPFIDMLKEKAEIHELSSMDYRKILSLGQSAYHYPHNNPQIAELSEKFIMQPESLVVAQGRTLQCQKASQFVAEFTFDELCKEAVSAPDFQAIGTRFTTLILRGVPKMTM